MKKVLGKSIGFILIAVICMLAAIAAFVKQTAVNIRNGIAYAKAEPEAGEVKVGVPTFSGIKESMISYALGIGGGLLYGISTSILGSGLFGGLLGAGVAGAAIKGVRGEIISTVLGFQTVVSAMNGANSASAAPARGIM